MAKRCVWRSCKEEKEGDNLIVVQFSNGNLSNTDAVSFSMYSSKDSENPRKKSRLIVAAETDRLSYVGNNFGTGSLRCNTLCNYYVGVLNKATKNMEVHSAQLFNMQPVIPGESTREDEPQKNASQSYRDKVDSLIEAFGTNKQKRALTSRRLNMVGSEALQHAVAKAANRVIEQKGLEALEQDVAQTESLNDASQHLPPCHPDADRPEDVYPFDDLISPVEYKALEVPAQKLTELSPDDLQKMEQDGSPRSVLVQLQTLPTEGERRHRQARCAWYLFQLIKLSQQKSNFNRKFSLEEGCPRVIANKLMKTFTAEVFSRGRIQHVVPASMRVKLAAYCLALLLHMGDQMADLTLLHRDLGMKEAKIVEVAKAMGLKLSKQLTTAGGSLLEEHRMATLVLPLVRHEKPTMLRKRKKMR
ncbi:DNA-directed RNA polymerase I subunit RPA49 [Scleropages formosus]|uniref:RNA polymerase I subunit E n=1 Tax=Scleropages formosus TaxID=113540 RepID=A0A8C9QZ95_SCLFO|nr:DNA-directed RNA polymerase I subunit RPA49 [Scleropages formosus]